MRFTIRDVLWLTGVVALGVGWLGQTARLTASKSIAQRLRWIVRELRDKGYEFSWDNDIGGMLDPPLRSSLSN